MWYQSCQRCKYFTSVDIQKRANKKLFTHVESHASAMSLLESGEQRYIKAINNNKYVTVDTKLGKDSRSEDGRVMTTIHNNYVMVDSKLTRDWQGDDHYTLQLRYGSL